MAQSRRLPAGISTRGSCIGDVAQKQQLGACGPSSNPLQTLARAGKLNEPGLKRLKSLLMLGDDVLWRSGDEVVVAKFGHDLRDFELLLGDLPIEARLLRSEVDDAGERQRNRFPAHDEKQSPWRRGLSGRRGSWISLLR